MQPAANSNASNRFTSVMEQTMVVPISSCEFHSSVPNEMLVNGKNLDYPNSVRSASFAGVDFGLDIHSIPDVNTKPYCHRAGCQVESSHVAQSKNFEPTKNIDISSDDSVSGYEPFSLSPLKWKCPEGSSKYSIDIKNHPSMLNEPTHSPKILKGTIAPRTRDFHRLKFSSTSTLFMNTTIKAPNIDEILRCMSLTLFYNIQKFERKKVKQVSGLFGEFEHPLTYKVNLNVPPTQEDIYEFLRVIFHSEQLSAECGVMALVYIDRIYALTGICLMRNTWRRICLACIIVASKVWEDQAVWNIDFLKLFPILTVQDLNMLEREVLNCLQFNVGLKASVYAKYYFELRSLSERDERYFPLEPLVKDEAKRLEERSLGITYAKKRLRRSLSMDYWNLPSSPVSLP